MLLAFAVFGGWLAAPYIADPDLIPRPWFYGVALLAAVVVFASVATLTSLGYCLIFLRDVEAAREFWQRVSNYAAIGAVTGTLLGLRLALPLLLARRGNPGVPEFILVEFVGLIGSTTTVFTLVMIAACWPWIWGPVRAVGKEGLDQSAARGGRDLSWLGRHSQRGAGVWVLLVAFAGNMAGLDAAVAVWAMLV